MAGIKPPEVSGSDIADWHLRDGGEGEGELGGADEGFGFGVWVGVDDGEADDGGARGLRRDGLVWGDIKDGEALVGGVGRGGGGVSDFGGEVRVSASLAFKGVAGFCYVSGVGSCSGDDG